jgi:uncharacterized iron-regulated protein
MARALEAAIAQAPPGTQVVLLAGAQHASRDRGVPLHLRRHTGAVDTELHVVLCGVAGAALHADERRSAELTPQPDYCATLRRGLGASGTADGAASAASR